MIPAAGRSRGVFKKDSVVFNPAANITIAASFIVDGAISAGSGRYVINAG